MNGPHRTSLSSSELRDERVRNGRNDVKGDAPLYVWTRTQHTARVSDRRRTAAVELRRAERVCMDCLSPAGALVRAHATTGSAVNGLALWLFRGVSAFFKFWLR